MSMTRVCICLIFLTFLTSPLVLCSRNPKKVAPSAAMHKKIGKKQIHAPALFVSSPSKVDSSSSSMIKIDKEPATNSAISVFFRYRFPFQGWPFHKYGPYPVTKPAHSSVPTNPATGAQEEEAEKVPSSPSKGNRDGGNGNE